MAKKKSNINKYTNGLGINEIYSKISRGSSFIPGVIDESKLTSRIVKKDGTFKAKPFAKSYKSIRPVLSSGFSSRGNFRTNYTPLFDADAVAYFTAVEDVGGTLTALEKDLVNDWFVTERTAGRLSKYKAVYPFKGKTSGAAAINMVNPGTYDLSFINFVTADFAVSGRIQPDDSTKYAELNFIIGEDINQDDNLVHFQIEEGPTTNGHFWGAREAILGLRNITWYIESSKSTAWLQGGGIGTNFTHTYENKDSFTFNFSPSGSTTSTITPFLNGQALAAPLSRAHTDYTPLTSYLFAHHYVNGATDIALDHIGGIYTAVAFGEGFTDDEASTLNKSFKDISVDPDAQAYIQEVFDQGGTLSLAQQHAVNNLVKSMKADGLWEGAINIVPFMGGTVNSALTELKTRVQYFNVNFVDADADSKIGLTGDGSTKFTQSSQQISALMSGNYDIQMLAFADTTGIGAGKYLAGIQSTNYRYALRHNGGLLEAYGGGLLTDLATATLGTESNGLVRTSQTSLFALTDGTEGTEFTTSVTNILPSLPIWVFGRGTADYAGTMKGFVLAETWSLEQTKKFEKLYKAFIQQVQDGETYETDAAAYFQTVEDAGGTLTTNVKSEFNAFVSREIAAGRWSKLKRLYPYLGGKIDSARVDAINLGQATNNNFVDADADATIGLQGDGSTKFLTEQSNIDEILTSNSKFQVGVFFPTLNLTGSNQSLFGVSDTISGTNPTDYRLWNRIHSTGTPRYYSGELAAFTSPSFAAVSSSIARFNDTSAYALANGEEGIENTTDVSAYVLPPYAMGWFADRVNNTFNSFYANQKYIGAYIAELDTLQETKDFESSYKTFINNITA